LTSRATERARESLAKVDSIILNRARLPGDLVENAFRLRSLQRQRRLVFLDPNG